MALQRYAGTAPVPGTTVTVNESGTQVAATLFEDNDGLVPLPNPFTADAVTGYYTYVAEAAAYDTVLGQPDAASTTLDTSLPKILFTGVTPDRHAVLYTEDPDTWEQIIFADIVY